MSTTLAERFWSVARDFDEELTYTGDGHPDPVTVVRHILRVLDAFESGAEGSGVTVNTRSFLVLLRQHELQGDLLYASPEQARGEAVDERSLVFSVGVLLFEKLTGRHPFGAEGNPRRVARIRKGQMGSGVNYFPILPPELRMVLMRAMGPFPEERWASLAELRGQLEAFVADQPGATREQMRAMAQAVARAHAAARPPLVIQPTTRRREDESRPVAMPVPFEAPVATAHGTPAGGLRALALPEETPPVEAAPVPVAEPAPERDRRSRERQTTLQTRGPRFGSAAPLVWAAVGALFASAVFIVQERMRGPSVAPSAAQTTPPATAAVTATPAPAPAPAPDVTAAPMPSPTPAPAPASATAPAPAATTAATAPGGLPTWHPLAFDPQAAGSRALARGRTCFDPSRPTSFGVGLVFTSDDPLSKKIYFSADDGLTPEQRHCLKQTMIGVSADAPPPDPDGAVVEYSFRIDGETLEVKIRHAP
jgi:hypothetical protein